jgi:hypothetical protein
MNLKDLIKMAAPAVAGAFLGPAAGSALGATGIMANPFVQRALTSGAVGLLTGQKPKDAILSGIMGGVGGQFLDSRNPAMQQGLGASSKLANLNQSAMEQAAGLTKKAASAGAGVGSSAASAPVAETMSGDLLRSLGMAGDDEEGNLLFKIMNSQLGEGLAAGLVAQLLAGEEKDDPKGEFERRPFGAGGPGGQLGGINYEDGGEAYFPRRNGGIDPSEGSGKKDDVPAMLMAGEFVMTRDAVKGAGNGDLRKGIKNMYGMMDNFERMA